MLFVAVPKSLRSAITVGIGFFITMIGLKIGEITNIRLKSWAIPYIYDDCNVVSGSCSNSVDVNFAFYDNLMSNMFETPAARIAALGVVFVAVFETLKLPGSILMSIVLATFIGINYMDLHGGCKSVSDSNCVTKLMDWAHNNDSTYFFIVDVTDIPSGKLSFHYAQTPFFW